MCMFPFHMQMGMMMTDPAAGDSDMGGMKM